MECAETEDAREFVLKVAHKFSRCSHRTINYFEIAEDFRILSGARYVALNEVSDYGEYTTTKSIAGINESIKKVSKIFGFSLTDASYTVDPHIKKVFQADGIVEFENLCTLAGSQIPKAICEQTAALFGLGKTYALGISDYNGPIADLVFLCAKNQELRNRTEVQTLASVLSLCLQRVYAEQDTVLKLLSVCSGGGEARTAAYESIMGATDQMPDLIYHLDADGRIEFINQAIQRYGFDRNKLIGTPIIDLVHPDDKEEAKWKLAERRAGERRTRKFEVRLKTGNQHTVFFSLYNRKIPQDPVLLIDAEGLYTGQPGKSDFLGTLGVGHDITEQKQLQSELDQHTHMFRTIIENMGEAAWLEEIDPQQTLYLNPACERLFQVTAEQMQDDPSLWLRIIHPDDRGRVEEALVQLNTDHKLDPIEYRIFAEDGSERWVRSQVFPVEGPYGNVAKTVGIAHDITIQKQEEKLLQQSVEREKQYVREINHRVKNNLTMIDSMLNLEMGTINELFHEGGTENADYPAEILGKVKARIRAVGLVHEMLYSSSQDKAVEVGVYLHHLGESILEVHGSNGQEVAVEYCVHEPVWLPVGVTIPLGMIFSELFTNALKYAFPRDAKGHVWVYLKGSGHEEYELQVCDDGTALPEDFDKKTLSIGHSLIDSLAQQLNGVFEISTEDGRKCFKVGFKLT